MRELTNYEIWQILTFGNVVEGTTEPDESRDDLELNLGDEQ